MKRPSYLWRTRVAMAESIIGAAVLFAVMRHYGFMWCAAGSAALGIFALGNALLFEFYAWMFYRLTGRDMTDLDVARRR